MSERIQTFEEFWPYYLGEHQNQLCRVLHFIGTTAALSCLISAVALQNPWFILAGFAAGYGPAWVGHFFVEKNRPATFTYPGWSLIADFRMWGHMIMGRLWGENDVLEQAGLGPSAR